MWTITDSSAPKRSRAAAITGAIFTKFGRVPRTWTILTRAPRDVVEERDLVSDGALERLADVDVEMAALVLDQLPRGARSATLRAGPGGVTASALITWTRSGARTLCACATGR